MADKNLRVSIMLQMAEKVLGPLKNISQGSNETEQTLKAAREQLKLLEATQKDVGAFREIRTGLGETEAKLKVARDQVKQMSSAKVMKEIALSTNAYFMKGMSFLIRKNSMISYPCVGIFKGGPPARRAAQVML